MSYENKYDAIKAYKRRKSSMKCYGCNKFHSDKRDKNYYQNLIKKYRG